MIQVQLVSVHRQIMLKLDSVLSVPDNLNVQENMFKLVSSSFSFFKQSVAFVNLLYLKLIGNETNIQEKYVSSS